jgi:hypothetical protein
MRLIILAHRGQTISRFTPKALLEFQHTDDSAAMNAITDLARLIPGLNIEQHRLALDPCYARNRPNPVTNRGRREMADVDVHSNTDEAWPQSDSDGRSRRHFHMQDHHRRRIGVGHSRHKMTNRHVPTDNHGRFC